MTNAINATKANRVFTVGFIATVGLMILSFITLNFYLFLLIIPLFILLMVMTQYVYTHGFVSPFVEYKIIQESPNVFKILKKKNSGFVYEGNKREFELSFKTQQEAHDYVIQEKIKEADRKHEVKMKKYKEKNEFYPKTVERL